MRFVLGFALLVLWASSGAVAPPSPRVGYREQAFPTPTPTLAQPPAPFGSVLWVYDLNRAPLLLPSTVAGEATRVWLGCEVRAWVQAGNAPKDAVGAVGERGAAQLHPAWAGKMAEMGLHYDDERDRLLFAAWLVERDGWATHWVWCSKGVD